MNKLSLDPKIMSFKLPGECSISNKRICEVIFTQDVIKKENVLILNAYLEKKRERKGVYVCVRAHTPTLAGFKHLNSNLFSRNKVTNIQ